MKYQCRICLEEDELDKLICPCKCSGSIKYVHKVCLNTWRQTDDQQFRECEVCKNSYIVPKKTFISIFISSFTSMMFIYTFLRIGTIAFNFLKFIWEYKVIFNYEFVSVDLHHFAEFFGAFFFIIDEVQFARIKKKIVTEYFFLFCLLIAFFTNSPYIVYYMISKFQIALIYMRLEEYIEKRAFGYDPLDILSYEKTKIE